MTFREALAYEVMAELGFTAPRVRRARIEYRNTSPANGPSPRGWELARNAFILEDLEVLDFDLASWVTEVVRSSGPHAFYDMLSMLPSE